MCSDLCSSRAAVVETTCPEGIRGYTPVRAEATRNPMELEIRTLLRVRAKRNRLARMSHILSSSTQMEMTHQHPWSQATSRHTSCRSYASWIARSAANGLSTASVPCALHALKPTSRIDPAPAHCLQEPLRVWHPSDCGLSFGLASAQPGLPSRLLEASALFEPRHSGVQLPLLRLSHVRP